ncbi:MAG: hypothetical protein EF806_05735 [Candidatus Methanoliparum thermophilum]|uniref:Uncharacterized protein n=1 Tax=Methanoliparum thermophilum TaxID=2491083 RepID=A0A520KRS4_METT2|nr:hypothetical protein [Candidatus Methanoliparum sp. LAM-1]RZN64117.1 MAG: hypothetical protein EF806_05735 [Candidatus Methanoliparum thermophilum]BDC35620.1 hypothetical protein MTLP_03020 [Candidatus Methanoliparum sp. LAM-1]
MQIKTVITVLVVIFTLIPGLTVGISVYMYVADMVEELSKKDLEERTQAVIHGMDAIDRLK